MGQIKSVFDIREKPHNANYVVKTGKEKSPIDEEYEIITTGCSRIQNEYTSLR